VPISVGLMRPCWRCGTKFNTIREWTLNWIAAWNARDVDAIANLVTDDIVYDDPSMWGELVQGKDHFRANIAMVFRAFPDLTFVPSEWPPMVSMDGNHVAAPCRAITTFTGDMRGGPSRVALAGTGRNLDIFCVDLYQFRDGKLCRWTALNQELELARQAGLLPSGSLMSLLVRAQRTVAPLMRRLT
jgi:steroid delta-isomerase-like uncharacterized protein